MLRFCGENAGTHAGGTGMSTSSDRESRVWSLEQNATDFSDS